MISLKSITFQVSKLTCTRVKVCAFLVSMFDNKALRGVFEECGVFGKVCNAGNVPSTILKSIWDQAKALLVAWVRNSRPN